MRNGWLFSFILCFALGVASAVVFSATIYFGLFLMLLGGALFLCSFFFVEEKIFPVVIFSIGIFAVGIGVVRFEVVHVSPPKSVEQLVSKKVALEGVITSEPSQRKSNTHLRVTIQKIRPLKSREEGTSTFQKVSPKAKVLLFASRYGSYHYGERVRAVGKLQKPENFTGDNGREFDYIHYLGKDGVRYVMYRPSVKVVGEGEGNFIKGILFSLKEKFLTNISQLIPEPEASLLGGLVVGAKHSLGEALLNDFRTIGVIHIVVLSGYNVSLVSDFIMRVFSFLPRAFAGTIGGAGIALFVILTGASATAVRAGSMAVLVIVARLTGRTHDVLRLLFIVGFAMVFWNPKILLYDPSFQLSFLATLGLLLLSPFVTYLLRFLPKKWSIREIASATIATQIFVLPVILYMMGNVSLISVPANLAVLLFIPYTMLLGFLAGVVGFVSTALAIPLAYLAYLLLLYEIKTVTFFANIPHASFTVSSFPFWGMLLIYFSYILVYFLFRRRRSGTSVPREEKKEEMGTPIW